LADSRSEPDKVGTGTNVRNEADLGNGLLNLRVAWRGLIVGGSGSSR